jgi:putative DNA primase/helicase
VTSSATPAHVQDTPPRPVALVPQPASIPVELQSLPQWMAWAYELRDGKWTKPPRNPLTGEHGSHSDGTTWSTFPIAHGTYTRCGYDGVGFVLTDGDPYTALDLDKCRDPATGHIAEWAWAIIQRFASYTEVSPSGHGMRIFIRGVLPPYGRRKGTIEVYDNLRYVTLTGWTVAGLPPTIEDRQAELEAWHGEIWQAPAPPAARLPAEPVDLDDATLLAVMWNARNGAAIHALWNGDLSGQDDNASGADLALCNHLAFYTGRDAARMDRLFRYSSLFRPKWDESHYANGDTYGQHTIALACADCRETYQPPSARLTPIITTPEIPSTPPIESPLQDATGPEPNENAAILALRAALDQRDAEIAQLRRALADCKRQGTEKVREARRETALVRRIHRNPHTRHIASTLLATTYHLHAKQQMTAERATRDPAVQPLDPTRPQDLPCARIGERAERSAGQISRDLQAIKERGLVVIDKKPLDNGHKLMQVGVPALANGLMGALQAFACYRPSPAQAETLPQHGGDRRGRPSKLVSRLQRVGIPACEVHGGGRVEERYTAICKGDADDCGLVLLELTAQHPRLQDATGSATHNTARGRDVELHLATGSADPPDAQPQLTVVPSLAELDTDADDLPELGGLYRQWDDDDALASADPLSNPALEPTPSAGPPLPAGFTHWCPTCPGDTWCPLPPGVEACSRCVGIWRPLTMAGGAE